MPVGRAIRDTAEFRAMWADSALTVPHIADSLGVTETSVRRAARRFGYARRKTDPPPPLRAIGRDSDDVLRRLWKNPVETLETMAERFECSVSVLQRHARRLGLGPRPERGVRPKTAQVLRVVPGGAGETGPRVRPHPKFSDSMDSALMRCPRSWEKFAEYSAEWGLSVPLILQRWTALRRAA